MLYLFNFVDYSCLQRASNHKLFFHFYFYMSNYLIMKLIAVTILLLILALPAESCKKVLLISCFNLRGTLAVFSAKILLFELAKVAY